MATSHFHLNPMNHPLGGLSSSGAGQPAPLLDVTPVQSHHGVIAEDSLREGKRDVTGTARLRGDGASGTCT